MIGLLHFRDTPPATHPCNPNEYVQAFFAMQMTLCNPICNPNEPDKPFGDANDLGKPFMKRIAAGIERQ
jgi:hypothetical protein